MNMIHISIEGMSCGHCVQQVSKALRSVPGVSVEKVAVGNAWIEADDDAAVHDAVRAIENAGYKTMVAVDTVRAQQPKSGGNCCGG